MTTVKIFMAQAPDLPDGYKIVAAEQNGLKVLRQNEY